MICLSKQLQHFPLLCFTRSRGLQEAAAVSGLGRVTVSDFPTSKCRKNLTKPITIHGNGIFTYIFMVDFYGFHLGKYRISMDAFGLGLVQILLVVITKMQVNVGMLGL